MIPIEIIGPPTKEGLDIEIQSRSSVRPSVHPSVRPIYLHNQAQEFFEILHQYVFP